MVKTISWKKMVGMSPTERTEDFLVRVRGLPSELIQNGVVQVPLLELYQTLYTGVPAKAQHRDVLTRALKDNKVVSSTGQGRYATWTIAFPEAPASPGDGTMSDVDEDKKVPADERVEEPEVSELYTERRLAEIELSVQTRKVETLRFAEHVLEVAQANELTAAELDEAMIWVRKSL